jgi:hypothetical protein
VEFNKYGLNKLFFCLFEKELITPNGFYWPSPKTPFKTPETEVNYEQGSPSIDFRHRVCKKRGGRQVMAPREQ